MRPWQRPSPQSHHKSEKKHTSEEHFVCNSWEKCPYPQLHNKPGCNRRELCDKGMNSKWITHPLKFLTEIKRGDLHHNQKLAKQKKKLQKNRNGEKQKIREKILDPLYILVVVLFGKKYGIYWLQGYWFVGTWDEIMTCAWVEIEKKNHICC